MSQGARQTPQAAAAGTLRLGGSLSVNRFGFGAMRLTGRGIFGPPKDREECRRVVRRAVDLGVNFIDTADSYGPGVSEEIIAEALHPYPPGVVIATKAGLERPGPDQWVENGRPEHLRAQCEESLRRLRVARIELFQLHRIDSAVPEADQFGVLADLRREGKINFVGLSEVGVAPLKRALMTLPVVSVQNRYNLMDRAWEDVVTYCEQQGLAFIPWYPLGAGRLETPSALRRVARRHDVTPMQVALAWLLARSPIMLPIPGTSKVTHVEENIAATALSLTADDRRELDSLWQA